jgi:cobalt-zinc-cadmium efflux system outer membrane protein
MVSARRRVELLSQLEKLLQEAVKVNESLFKAAEVDKGTVLQAKLELGQVAALKRQAEADLRARTAALAGTLGGDFDTVASAGSDPWPEPRSFMAGGGRAESGGVIDEGMLIGQPYLSSPELAESYALIQAARCDVRLAETQIISNIESMASVQQDLATNSTIAGLQFGMAVPIHDRKTGLVRAARAELAKTEAEYARRQRDLETRWAEAVGEYQTAWELVRSIETELLDLAQQRYDLAVKAQRQGEISYIELLTAQRSLLSIREAVLSAREQAALAGIRLENLVVRDLQ